MKGSGYGEGSGSGSGYGNVYGSGDGYGGGYGDGTSGGGGSGRGHAIIFRDVFQLTYDSINKQKGSIMAKARMKMDTQHPDFGKYVIFRDKDAGVAAGNFISLNEKTKVGVLANARRIWYWEGAASLSQLAQEGTSKPNECKFPCEVTAIKFLNVCEVDYVSEKAEKSIKSVPVWKE